MPPLLLHVFPTFAVGGAQMRFAALANHFGPAWRHTVIAMDGNTACRERSSGPNPSSIWTCRRPTRALAMAHSIEPQL